MARCILKFGKDCGHCLTVLSIGLVETLLEFCIFSANHDRARNHREGCKAKACREAGAHGPGQHLAQVRQINGMTDPGADAVGHEALFRMFRADFRYPLELFQAEVHTSALIEPEADRKKAGRRKPHPATSVPGYTPPWRRD